MRVLSPMLHRVVYPVLGSMGYFRSRPLAPVTVITYHGVLSQGYKRWDNFVDNTLVSEHSFRSQLRLLKKHYNLISPEDFLRWLREGRDLPAKAILLTCDDGLLNHLSVMLPVLQEEDLKCLFFVTGSSLGSTPEMLWHVELYLLLDQAPARDEPFHLQGNVIPPMSGDPRQRQSAWLSLVRNLSKIDAAARRRFLDDAAAKLGMPRSWAMRYFEDSLLRNRFQLLRSQELKQLAGAGMTIGAHTLSHPVLAEQSVDLARAEISKCRDALEQGLGREVWAVAYPFGDPASVGAREFQLAEEAGYECGFVNVGGTLDPLSARFALPRAHVSAEMSLSVYEAYISGFHDAIRSRFRPDASSA